MVLAEVAGTAAMVSSAMGTLAAVATAVAAVVPSAVLAFAASSSFDFFPASSSPAAVAPFVAQAVQEPDVDRSAVVAHMD